MITNGIVHGETGPGFIKGPGFIRPAQGSHLEEAAALVASQLESPVQRHDPRGNVLSGAAHHDAIAAALGTIARTVARTLGPHGSNTLIRDEAGGHLATKDGYTVLQRLTFVQETATMVLDHVRAVSRAMVRKVGDGSTSAVVMADALYTSLRQSSLLDRFPPGAVQATIAVVADQLGEAIRSVARPLGPNDILAVATVAANNDSVHGAIVADAYATHGSATNVFVMEGGEETVVRAEPGYRVLRGMVDDCFANRVGLDGATATTCLLQDAVVMVVGEIVSQTVFNSVVAPAMNESIQAGHSFVLVGRDYDSAVIRTVSEFVRRSPGVRLLMLDHATATRRGAARLGDLAAVLGATVLGGCGGPMPSSLTDLLTACGYADAVRATGSETVFVIGERGPGAAARLAELEAQIDRVDENDVTEELADELAELRARRRAILGSEVTILAGGATHLERQALVHLLDDAALAVKSAMRSGVVEGLVLTGRRALSAANSFDGDETIRRTCERTRLPKSDVGELISEVLLAFYRAFGTVARTVLLNSRVENPDSVIKHCIDEDLVYNAVTRDYAPRAEATVINPADTDIEIVRGAASIVSLFVASNQTVLTRPLVGGNQD